MTTTLDPIRVGRMTASRLPKLLGLSPHGNRDSLMREMVREYFGDEPDPVFERALDWGHEHEAEAVAEYELTRGHRVTATGAGQETIVHPDLDFIVATPDGRIDTSGLVEVKCPWRARYTHWRERPDIEAQMRLQMECTEQPFCDLIVWYPDEPIFVSRLAWEPDWFTLVRPEIEAFLDDFIKVIEDETLAKPYRAALVDQRTDQEFLELCQVYNELSVIGEAHEAEVKAVRDQLFALCGESKTTKGGGLTISRSVKKGSVSYKDALDKYAPDADLAPFTGPDATEPTYTIRRAKSRH